MRLAKSLTAFRGQLGLENAAVRGILAAPDEIITLEVGDNALQGLRRHERVTRQGRVR